MLRDDMKQAVEIATVKAEDVKKDVLAILSNELGQLKSRLTKLENKLSEKPAVMPKK